MNMIKELNFILSAIVPVSNSGVIAANINWNFTNNIPGIVGAYCSNGASAGIPLRNTQLVSPIKPKVDSPNDKLNPITNHMTLKSAKPKKANTIAAKASGGLSKQQVLARSSGIKTDTLTAPAETVALTSIAGTELDETLDEKALAKAEEEAASRVKYRSEKSINLIVERLKGSLITLYNRERRKDPFLEGMLVVELIIEPSGSVSSCRVISSELNHEILEKKMVNRIYLTDFGAEEVEQTTKNIPFTFKT